MVGEFHSSRIFVTQVFQRSFHRDDLAIHADQVRLLVDDEWHAIVRCGVGPLVLAADPGALIVASNSGPQWDDDLVVVGVDEEQLITFDEVQLSSATRDLEMMQFRQGIELGDRLCLAKYFERLQARLH